MRKGGGLGSAPGLANDGKARENIDYYESINDPKMIWRSTMKCKTKSTLSGRDGQVKALITPSRLIAPMGESAGAVQGNEPRVASGSTTEPVSTKSQYSSIFIEIYDRSA